MDDFVELYLKRIGCENAVEPSVENLARLQEAHLRAVPYENIDLLYGRETGLDETELFRKIVLNHRGGYCFELNGLFAVLLRKLGYQVTEYFGRWHLGENAEIPMRRHRVLKTVIGNRAFLPDVGVGCACPLTTLEFTENRIQENAGGRFRIVRDPRFGSVVQIEKEGQFVPFFSFTEDPHYPQDFEYVHFFCSHHPSSVFLREIKVHKFCEDGRASIWDVKQEDGRMARTLMRSGPGGTIRKTELSDEKALRAALAEHFGIVFPQQQSDAREINSIIGKEKI